MSKAKEEYTGRPYAMQHISPYRVSSEERSRPHHAHVAPICTLSHEILSGLELWIISKE